MRRLQIIDNDGAYEPCVHTNIAIKTAFTDLIASHFSTLTDNCQIGRGSHVTHVFAASSDVFAVVLLWVMAPQRNRPISTIICIPTVQVGRTLCTSAKRLLGLKQIWRFDLTVSELGR